MHSICLTLDMNGKTLFLTSLAFSISILLIELKITKLKTGEADHYDYPKFTDLHIAGLILARGGSKGIIHKNLAKLSNVTLLGNSLKVILEFGKFNSVWVSTDDKDIALEASKFRAEVHVRDALTATDNAPSILGVLEFIHKHPEVHVVGLIQCTSPFLKKKYLEKAFSLLREGYHSVFSVTRQFKLRWKINGDGSIVPDNFSPLNRPRRQDWTGDIIENGMFYFSFSELINKTRLLQSGRMAIVEVPQNESLEIDSSLDLVLANALLDNLKNQESAIK